MSFEMTSMSEVISLRINPNAKERFELLADKYKLQKGDLIEYLINLAYENHLLEPNWKDLIQQDKVSMERLLIGERLKGDTYLHDLRESSREKDRQHDGKMLLMKEYIRALPPSERPEFFDRMMKERRILSRGDYMLLPEKVKDGYAITINSKRLVVKELLQDGTPKLDYNQDRLVKCERGFHTKETWCQDCDLIANCPTVRRERLEAISR